MVKMNNTAKFRIKLSKQLEEISFKIKKITDKEYKNLYEKVEFYKLINNISETPVYIVIALIYLNKLQSMLKNNLPQKNLCLKIDETVDFIGNFYEENYLDCDRYKEGKLRY